MTLKASLVMLVVACCANLNSAPDVSDVADVVAQMHVLPRHYLFRESRQTPLIRPEHIEAVKAAAALNEEQALRLLQSESPKERGVGLWSLYTQDHHQALFDAHELLDDDAPTLPWEGRAVGWMVYEYEDQTVGEYLAALYRRVLGLGVAKLSTAEFQAMYAEVTDTDALVGPWVFQLNRAIYDVGRSAALKTEIRRLPEKTRWLIVAESRYAPPHGYTPEEAAAEFALLSADTKRKIMDGTIEPPLDPVYRKRVDGRAVNEWRNGAPPKWLLSKARSHLTGAAPAAPAEEEKPAAEPPVEAPPG